MKKTFVKSLADILKEKEAAEAASTDERPSSEVVNAKRPVESAPEEAAPAKKKQATEDTSSILDRRPVKTINRLVVPAQSRNAVKAGAVVVTRRPDTAASPKTPGTHGTAPPVTTPPLAAARPSPVVEEVRVEQGGSSPKLVDAAHSPVKAPAPAAKVANRIVVAPVKNASTMTSLVVPASSSAPVAAATTPVAVVKPVIVPVVNGEEHAERQVSSPKIAASVLSPVTAPASATKVANRVVVAPVKNASSSPASPVVPASSSAAAVAATAVAKPVIVLKPEVEPVRVKPVISLKSEVPVKPVVSPKLEAVAVTKPVVTPKSEVAAKSLSASPTAAVKPVNAAGKPVVVSPVVFTVAKAAASPVTTPAPASLSPSVTHVPRTPPPATPPPQLPNVVASALAGFKKDERAAPVAAAPVNGSHPDLRKRERLAEPQVDLAPARSVKVFDSAAAAAVLSPLAADVEPPLRATKSGPAKSGEENVADRAPREKWKVAYAASAALASNAPPATAAVVWRELWKCQKCERDVSGEKNVCDKCGAFKSRSSRVNRQWKCGCAVWRGEELVTCEQCGKDQMGELPTPEAAFTMPSLPGASSLRGVAQNHAVANPQVLTATLVQEFRDRVRSLLPATDNNLSLQEVLNAVRSDWDVVPGSLLHDVLLEEFEFHEHAARIHSESVAVELELLRPPKLVDLPPPPPGFMYANGGYDNELEQVLAVGHKLKSRMEAAANGNHGAIYEVLGHTRNVDEFQRLAMVGEGSHGVVYKAQDKKLGKEVRALKRIKLLKQFSGFPAPALREIGFLSRMQHVNVVKIMGMAVGESLEKVFCVLEYVEHDLGELIGMHPTAFTEAFIKTVTRQMVAGVRYLHDVAGVYHRDLKPSNMLYSRDGVVKLCDFGLAISNVSEASSCAAGVVGTRWYRAPEMVLLSPVGGVAPVDMWAIGCVVVEMVTHEPLFKVKDDLSHVAMLRRVLGAPNDINWSDRKLALAWPSLKDALEEPDAVLGTAKPLPLLPGFIAPLSPQGRAFIRQLLVYDSKTRPLAAGALVHNWFSSNPYPITNPALLPQFDDLSREEWARKKSKSKAKRRE